MNSVWITGVGSIAPSGFGLESIAAAGMAQRPALVPWPEDFSPPHHGALIGSVSQLPSERYFTSRQLRMMDRAMEIAASTVGLALEDAKIEHDSPLLNEMGTFFATSRAEYPSMLRFLQPLAQGRQVNPAHYPLIARNIALGQLCIRFGLRGPSTLLASGPLGAIEALGRATDFIRQGRCDIAVVGGFEVLSKYQCDFAKDVYHPMQAGKPEFFGKVSGYLAPAEGACAVIVESPLHAQRRNAVPLAQVDAYISGRVSDDDDPKSVLAPLIRLQQGLGRRIQDIGALLPCAGGSNRSQERREVRLLEVFLEHHELPLCAVRSLTGEAETASGALQIGLGIHALQTGSLPPTLHISATASERLQRCAQAGRLTRPRVVVSAYDEVGRYAFLHMSA